MQRRSFIKWTSAAALAAVPLAGSAQSSSTKPIRLIVPFPPGGATDITARLIAEPLSRQLGQAIIIENKAGAGGSVGMTELARAAPDGFTLGMATVSTHGVNPAIYKKLPYNVLTDFSPISALVTSPNVLAIHPSVKATNHAEFLKLLKASPGKLSYATPGSGSLGHMLGELYKSTTGTFLLHIPYRGAGPALNDVIGGQVEVIFDNLPSSLPHIKAGKLRALAVSSPKRLESLPDVPTFAELLLASNNDLSWFGLVAPAKTPDAQVSRFHAGVKAVLASAEVRAKLQAMGLNPLGNDPVEFAGMIKREVDKMTRVSKYAKISLD